MSNYCDKHLRGYSIGSPWYGLIRKAFDIERELNTIKTQETSVSNSDPIAAAISDTPRTDAFHASNFLLAFDEDKYELALHHARQLERELNNWDYGTRAKREQEARKKAEEALAKMTQDSLHLREHLDRAENAIINLRMKVEELTRRNNMNPLDTTNISL